MGQNNSTVLHSHPAPNSPRTKPQKTPPPPRPASPKTPNYAVQENRVIPEGAMQLPNKRQLLRPVSQELTKFHPEYADIFQYNDPDPQVLDGFESTEGGSGGRHLANGSAVVDGKENNFLLNGQPSSTKENGGIGNTRLSHTTANGDVRSKPNNIELSRSHSLQEKRSNGHVLMNGHVNTNPNGSDVTDAGRSGGAVQRTNSLDRGSSAPGKVRAHKRFPSASNSLANEASVIPEDPREHLYTHWRQDPFSNPTPTVTSLPVKNAFDIDYKMNLTYAQLAEHRRQKRLSDLEDKTGKKLSDLNTDLQDQSTVPVSPFDRANYTPVKATTSSTTGSSDTGVSKSKKRRAPPPPGAGGPASAAAGRSNRDCSPGRLSLDMEPPADYDLDDPSPPLDIVSPWRTNLSRTNSSASAASGVSRFSRNSKGPAPTPPPPPPAPAPPPPPVASVAPPPPPPPPPPVVASSTLPKAAGKPSVSSPTANGTLPSKASTSSSAATAAPGSAASARLIAQAKAEIEALKKLEAILKEKDTEKETPEEKKEGAEEKQDGGEAEKKNDTDARKDEEAEEAMQTSDGKASPMSFSSADTDTTHSSTSNKGEAEKGNSPRRLNSLLQHDIVLAAQARGAKGQIKAKTPVQHVKPKDPAQLFREELAKAATAREERVKSLSSEKDAGMENGEKGNEGEGGEEGALVFQSDLVKVKRKTLTSDVTPATNGAAPETKPSPPPVSPKPESPTKDGSKPQLSKSESDLVYVQTTTTSSDPSQRPRQRIPDDDVNALRKAASHDGTLDLSDDDDDKVVMRTERASSSSRQFPEDWKPEDDLDSDDDIMDDLTYSRNSAMMEASDGFKSSIIPSKVDDLKSAKRKNSKSGRRESSSSTEDKTKFGSIRKFQKSVHKGVRQAFGSISKASGKLLRRNKSHDLGLEDVEGKRYRAAEDDLRPRAASLDNGLDEHPAMNGHLSESDEEFFDEDDLDDNAVLSGSDKQLRMMKRAGVAYVGSKGQIVVLPEFETVQVDEEGKVVEERTADEGRAPKIFKKKKKKFTYESTVRRLEKDKAAEVYAEEIRQKERQIEFERRKQQDMEREFQRLRDMETQERLQRLQTAQLQQQLNLLQQQQQQLTSLQFMQPTSHLSSTPHHSHHHHQQYSGQAGGLYTTSAGLGGQLPAVNMSSYAVQSTPFVTPATTATATTVAGYDVNYLSNYMRMMGIQPPSTQQQWAYLLSSVQGMAPQSLFDPSSSSKAQALLSGSAAPDLSHLFPPSKNPGPPYSEPSALVAQKTTLMNILSSGQLPQALPPDGVTEAVTAAVPVQNTATYHNAAAAASSKPLSASSGSLLPASTGSLKKQARPKSMGALDRAADDLLPDAQERSNPVYFSSDDDEEETRRRGQGEMLNSSRSARSASRYAQRTSSSGDRRRPHSTALLPVSHPSVYHDVTRSSAQEMAVTRVQVPDYRTPDVYVVDDVADDADDADSSLEDVRDMNGRVMSHVNGGASDTRSSATIVLPGAEAAVPSSAGDDSESKSVQFHSNGPTTTTSSFASSREASTSLPPKVYAPLGYKPVTFTPASPLRTKLQAETSVDR